MAKMTLRKSRQEAAHILAPVEDAYERLEALLDAFPIDLDAVPEKMLDSTVRPSMAFYLYGALSCAREGLGEARKHLRRSANARAAAIEREWRERQA